MHQEILRGKELLERKLTVMLKRVAARADARYAFNVTIQLLILFSVICFSIETLPNLSDGVRYFLKVSEVIVVVIFTLEYALRIMLASKKISFIFSFYGIVDLLSILPFYIGLVVDLRSLRALRFLRLTRVFKLLRYRKSVIRYIKAFYAIRADLVVFGFASVILFYLASVGIYYFEHESQPDKFASIFDALWWSVATLTTVGYGDVYPITVMGKVFTFIILMIGLGIMAIPAGLIASVFVESRVGSRKKNT